MSLAYPSPTAEEVERMVPVARLDVTIDFLAGVTVKSFESGGIILIDRATHTHSLQKLLDSYLLERPVVQQNTGQDPGQIRMNLGHLGD